LFTFEAARRVDRDGWGWELARWGWRWRVDSTGQVEWLVSNKVLKTKVDFA